MLKFKKLLSTFTIIVILIVSFATVAEPNAAKKSLTEEMLLQLDKAELLESLQEEGLTLPEDYSTHIDLAEEFVYKYTPMITEGKIVPSIQLFNYDRSNEMLQNLYAVLYKMGFVKNTMSSRASYVLQDSTLIGSWNNSYSTYNCYAYSLGRTSGLLVGALSGSAFSITMSIAQMADVVLEDLDSQGFWGYKTTTKPNSLPDAYFNLIVIRKDTSNEDYHFMKPDNATLKYWSHKPGPSQPLSWKYISPEIKIWTNEGAMYGQNVAPTITYESAVYYILYKSKSAPGIQPWAI